MIRRYAIYTFYIFLFIGLISLTAVSGGYINYLVLKIVLFIIGTLGIYFAGFTACKYFGITLEDIERTNDQKKYPTAYLADSDSRRIIAVTWFTDYSGTIGIVIAINAENEYKSWIAKVPGHDEGQDLLYILIYGAKFDFNAAFRLMEAQGKIHDRDAWEVLYNKTYHPEK